MSLTLLLPPSTTTSLLPTSSHLPTTSLLPPTAPPPTHTLVPPLPVTQLAQLASQHHASAYNCSKYGPQGCPIRYVPLSVHMPDHVRDLQRRQRIAAAEDPWWPCDSPQSPAPPRALVSAIIPFELIPLISSHLLLSAVGPTIFDIPLSFTLDRLTLSHQHDQSIPRLPPPPSIPSPTTQMVVNQLRTRSTVSEALKVAINTTVTVPVKPDVSSASPEPLATFHTNSSTVSLALSLTVTVALDEKNHSAPSSSSPGEPAFTIGNIFLSSCPGKKVRLHGPTLHADNTAHEGAWCRCIICCLDDTELEFSGAPWRLYERAAKAVGISVLRARSASPASLDAHLIRIIDAYTLRGVPILVHAGRPCCWMLKLDGDDSTSTYPSAGGLRRDAVRLVSG
ncbi:hypothetical protein B0H10DRAFT_2070375 [Mycena sp. CBHHK59/15]|nr:hypothetical protein B0H10DRAFT_2070375 [Mycena sp. CBHHK59/15]